MRFRQVGKALVWGWSLLALGVDAQLPPEASSQTPSQEGSIAEEIAIVEASTLIALPGLDRKAASRLVPYDFLLLEAGVPRTVIGIDPLDKPQEGSARPQPLDWCTTIYVDTELSEVGTSRLALAALSRQTALLTDLGPVSVVAADPRAREIEPPTRDGRSLAFSLSSAALEISGQDRIDALRSELRRSLRSAASDDRKAITSSFARAEQRLIQRQLDEMVTALADRCPSGPRLLLLVASGFVTQPPSSEPPSSEPRSSEPQSRELRSRELRSPESLESADPVATAMDRAARQWEASITSLGWTVITLPFVELRESFQERPRPGTDFESWTQELGGVSVGRSQKGRNRFSDHTDSILSPYFDTRTERLSQLSAASLGAMVSNEDGLELELPKLRRLFRLRYRTERRRYGETRDLSLSWAEDSPFKNRRVTMATLGLVKDEQPIRHPRWVRSGPIPGRAESRLRATLRRLEWSDREGSEPLPAGWRGGWQRRPQIEVKASGAGSEAIVTLSGEAGTDPVLWLFGEIRDGDVRWSTQKTNDDASVRFAITPGTERFAVLVERQIDGAFALETRTLTDPVQ